ncbi:MAG: carbonic anhydrase [Pseudomonadota bacterium]
MQKISNKFLKGYQTFRQKYATGDQPIMDSLATLGQTPEIMVVTCCDSRVDPALILQCNPGDLFVVRNVAGIVPPYEQGSAYHGTSAALEFGIRFLKTKHLIILGHSQCGGIQTIIEPDQKKQTDFIKNWVSLVKTNHAQGEDMDAYAKRSLGISCQNCLTFPWIRKRVARSELNIHLWFFEIKTGTIFVQSPESGSYEELGVDASPIPLVG